MSTEDRSLDDLPLSRRDILLALTFGLAGAGAGAGVLAGGGSDGQREESADDADGGREAGSEASAAMGTNPASRSGAGSATDDRSGRR